jgi:hypothetical protein
MTEDHPIDLIGPEGTVRFTGRPIATSGDLTAYATVEGALIVKAVDAERIFVFGSYEELADGGGVSFNEAWKRLAADVAVALMPSDPS